MDIKCHFGVNFENFETINLTYGYLCIEHKNRIETYTHISLKYGTLSFIPTPDRGFHNLHNGVG